MTRYRQPRHHAPLLATIMVLAFLSLSLMSMLLCEPPPCMSEVPCSDGKSCPAPWQCCDTGCCAPGTAPPRLLHDHKESPWYAQWPVLFLLGTLGGIMLCCIYCLMCKRPSPNSVYMCSFACCVRRPTSNQDSAGSLYPPPRYSRCGSLHQAPPPYSEVTSKPDLYPLVITCGEGDGKASNYLMVQYFPNYVIRAPGSLSATSTAESLNSSYLCSAANEANTIIPPPYSCASNYDDCGGGGCGRSLLRSLSSLTEPRAPPAPPLPPRAPPPLPPRAPVLQPGRTREATAAFRENLITSPVQPLNPSFDLDLELIDCELLIDCDGGCKPRLGTSPPSHRSPSNLDEDGLTPGYDREAYGLCHLFSCPSPEGAGACESPPQPTSPTQSRESTLRRPSDERRHQRMDPKKIPRARMSSLYMPLSVAYPVRTSRKSPGARASSRSAPATPCNPLVPNLLNYAPRVLTSRHSSRSSRCDEESNPLLSEIEHMRLDHKF